MNIEVKVSDEGGYEVNLTKVFSGVTIRTEEGKNLYVCLRDWGFDVKIDDGAWHHLNNESDFKK